MQRIEDARIAVIGLGYVGLPLAAAFGKQLPVVGFDIDQNRIDELNAGVDHTLELGAQELGEAAQLSYTSDPTDMAECNVFIVTTPTPIDEHKRPNLVPLLSATRTVAHILKPADVVIYESTVYPGATEEDCIPLLEELSGLRFNVDFFAGYSPERINPGDKQRRVHSIVKVTSGSTAEIADFVDALYARIVTAGTHKAPSIRVAEAAKVIENTQRDVNIALMNELSMLFNKLGINTSDVLAAAGTKWNFLPFTPGLVGGHCIGVDPYYLTHKAQQVGHHPEMILAGRRINDGMGAFVASQLVKHLTKAGAKINGSRVLLLGLTFKENTPDLRNTRVIDVITELEDYGIDVDVYDPWADPIAAQHEYGITLVAAPEHGAYDGMVVAVAHKQFIADSDLVRSFGKPDAVVYDLKHVLPANEADLTL